MTALEEMASEDLRTEGRSDVSEGFGGFSERDLESRSNSFDSRVLGSEDSGFWESSRPGSQSFDFWLILSLFY